MPYSLTLLSPVESGLDGPFVDPPLFPPIDWFTDETADAAPSKLTIFPNGRVAGIVAPSGRCLLDGSAPEDCWMVPRPADGRGSTLFRDGGDLEDYSTAMVGTTWCAIYEGAEEYVEIPTACLAGPGGHADAYANIQDTQIHYGETEYQVARGRYVWSDVAGGLVLLGAVWPDLTDRQIASARASACSIDYRWITDEERWRLIATCLVNVGGLPSRYSALRASLDNGDTLLISEQMRQDLLAAADGPMMRQAVCASLGLQPPSITPDDPSVEESQMTTRVPVPPTITPPAPEQQHTHTAAPGEACSCGKSPVQAAADPAVEVDHPAVVAASTEGELNAEAFGAAEQAAAPATEDQAASRRAAFVLVEDDDDPDWGDEVTWAGGVGMFCDSVTLIDGTVIWLVYPQVDGEIDWNPVGIMSTQGTLTGREYDYLDPWDYDLDSVVLEPVSDDAETVIVESAELASVRAALWTEGDDGGHQIASLGARLAGGRRLTSQAQTPIEHHVASVQRSSDERMDRLEGLLASVAETLHEMAPIVAATAVQQI